ncbi:hypothetical protein KMW28_16905 [Flammeovirga yaeyamensis]|uniref:HTH luxR-type domain-containing protein n=1 Tax=Flammeovirga yaeyamensis TaxID=367791 RepID=A0AAX1N634_9BACT|nr:tetratricopeptide repeat protein [Flammeovirga yaeyamensis]MBB3698305.1 DNA-binding CsgD family transcriptional regulator [Flammeovirga yaeyamensis]NMF34342.1 hypothetical protein [Flammeovirga yaeyamensis]QWG01323.1 hypothetical protein KMW28_16905 [Flammeovirga yaeyamensis]
MNFISKLFFTFAFLFISSVPKSVSASNTSDTTNIEKLWLLDSLQKNNENERVDKGLNELRSTINDQTPNTEQVLFYALEGERFSNQSNMKGAIRSFEKLLDIPSNSLDRKVALIQAKGINDLGIEYMHNGELEKAKKAHFKSLEIYQAYDDPQGGSFNYGNLSIIYKEQKQIDSAMYYLSEATKMAILAKDTLGIAYHSLSHGILLIDNHEPIKGLKELSKSKYLFQNLNNDHMIHYTNRIMAGGYKSIKDYTKAKELLATSKDYYEQTKDLKRLGQTNLTIGEMYFELDQLDSGYSFIKEGIICFETSRYVKGLVKAFHLSGEYFAEKGEYDKAIDLYQRSLSLSKGKYKGMTSNSKLALARINYHQKDYQKAYQLTEEAYKISNGSLNEGTEMSYFKLMYELNAQFGNYKKALYYLEQLDKKKSESFIQERANEVARIEYNSKLMYEQERFLLKQEQERALFQNQLENERLIKYVAILITALVLVILLALYRSYQQRKRTNVELLKKNNEISELRLSEKELAEETLALKERELATITMLSHERNTLLDQLNNQISKLSGKVDDEVIPDIKDIKKTIKLNLSDDSWSDFTYQFEKVHPRFFEKLKTKYPLLTQRDHKICAYLRVGMERKEIATVSNMTPEAVKKTLYRIKKKMDLTADDNLRELVMGL